MYHFDVKPQNCPVQGELSLPFELKMVITDVQPAARSEVKDILHVYSIYCGNKSSPVSDIDHCVIIRKLIDCI